MSHSPEQMEQLMERTLARNPVAPLLGAELVPLSALGITLSVSPKEFVEGHYPMPSCGKFEAEKVGCRIVELAAGDSEWNAVPWPKLVGNYLDNDELHVAASLGMMFSEEDDHPAFSVEEYIVNLAELPRLTVVQPEEEECTELLGCLGSRMFEKSRKNGIPQSLALGVGVLLKLGYIRHIPRAGNEPDLLAPTDALLARAKEIATMMR